MVRKVFHQRTCDSAGKRIHLSRSANTCKLSYGTPQQDPLQIADCLVNLFEGIVSLQFPRSYCKMGIYYLIQIDVGRISVCEKHNITICISVDKIILTFTVSFSQYFHFIIA